MKIAVLCLLVWIALGAAAQADTSEQDLAKLKSAIASLQRQLGQNRGQHSELQSRLRKDEIAIGALNADIRANRKQQDKLQQELSSLKQRQRQLAQQRNEQQLLIAAQMRSAYQLGQEKTLKVLLNQQDPALISRAMAYVDYFNQARLQQIQQFDNTITELRELEPAIESNKAALDKAGQDLKTDKKQLEQQQQSRRQTLASLSRTIETGDAQLQRHRKDHARLEALIDTVADITSSFATMEDAQPFASRKGKMKWPARGSIANRFGSRRQQGGLRWQGVEIRAAEGNSVAAIHHGRVVFADWLSGQGLLIVIDHGDGYMSLYGHNQSLLRETGDWIRTGETIATVGESGGRDKAGLYFEVRHKGVASNPANWCGS